MRGDHGDTLAMVGTCCTCFLDIHGTPPTCISQIPQQIIAGRVTLLMDHDTLTGGTMDYACPVTDELRGQLGPWQMTMMDTVAAIQMISHNDPIRSSQSSISSFQPRRGA